MRRSLRMMIATDQPVVVRAWPQVSMRRMIAMRASFQVCELPDVG
jgi:hypothetical protein